MESARRVEPRRVVPYPDLYPNLHPTLPLLQGTASAPKSPGDAFSALQDTIIGPTPSLALVPIIAPDPPPLYYGVCVIDSCPPSSANGGTSQNWASGGGSAAFYAEGGWKQAVDAAFQASMAAVRRVRVGVGCRVR